MTDPREPQALALGVLALVVLGAAVAPPAAQAGAPDAVGQPDDQDTGDLSAWIGVEVAEACRAFVPAAAATADVAWNQLLSFASCVQDARVRRITDPEELAPLVDELYDALWPSLALYLHALEYGPPTVQLRAAFLAGMANISLITRLRSSLVSPGGGANALALRHYRELRDRLEPMLGRARDTALIAFTAIDRACAEEPAIASDPVTRGMVRAARDLLRAMAPTPRERAWLTLSPAGVGSASPP